MALVFQTPKKMPSFAGRVPVYKINTPSSKVLQEEIFEITLPKISQSLGLGNIKPTEDQDHFIIRSGSKMIRFFKASNTFYYLDEDLTAGAASGNVELPTPKKAMTLAIDLMREQGLLDNYSPNGKLFETYYSATGYTTTQSAQVFKDGDTLLVKDESTTKKLEISSHFGYLLGGLPVFGPGAKTIVSYVGSDLSEEIHFWRPPLKMVEEMEIIAPITALQRLSQDKRFVNVSKVSKKKNHLASGRFYDDVQLGYYALTPSATQKFYLPVYKIRGTYEARLPEQGTSSQFNQDTFRYDFEHYVLALHGNAKGLGLNQFKHNIIW